MVRDAVECARKRTGEGTGGNTLRKIHRHIVRRKNADDRVALPDDLARTAVQVHQPFPVFAVDDHMHDPQSGHVGAGVVAEHAVVVEIHESLVHVLEQRLRIGGV